MYDKHNVSRINQVKKNHTRSVVGSSKALKCSFKAHYMVEMRVRFETYSKNLKGNRQTENTGSPVNTFTVVKMHILMQICITKSIWPTFMTQVKS